MIIEYEGQPYPFDFEDIGVRQGIAIEAHTGLPFAEWGTSLEKGGNLKSLQALGWMIIDGGNLAKPIADCDFKMGRLGAALEKAMAAAAKAREDAVPGPTAAAAAADVTSAESNGARRTGLLLPVSSDPA